MRKAGVLFLCIILLSSMFTGCKKSDVVIEDINYDIITEYKPRVNFGAKFEPKGNYILHGAGQDQNGSTVTFDKYVTAINNDNLIPAITMGYTAPHHNYFDWTGYMKQGLDRYPDNYLLPQIGVHFNRDEDPNSTYYEAIAKGEMDTQLKALINCIKSFNRPVYLRPGFEFNGEWNGYKIPEFYKFAFIRFKELVDECGATNIALLWCYNPDAAEKDYMKYYPGDKYVDWWAIDIFRIGSIGDKHSKQFLKDAEQHKKPVMLTEVTPYTFDITKGQGWNEWFVPFFNYVKQNPVIKGICYINWKWTDYPQWSNWGDARMEESANSIKANYIQEISDLVYLHSRSKEKMSGLLYQFDDGGAK